MKRTRITKWIVTVCTGIAFLFAFIFSTGGGVVGLKKDNKQEAITASAEATPNSKYDRLPNGGGYAYTDSSKVAAYRAGTGAIDFTGVTVDYAQAHGSALNPYVINTVAQWTSFAGDTASATNAGIVFVLGSDIDFAGKTFAPIPNLNAKFYGLNHKLSNITYNFNQTAAGNGGGVFVNTGATIIADLALDGVTLSGIDTHAGILCGKSAATILNCHVRGKLTCTSRSQTGTGGLVGTVTGNFYAYRCSVFADFVINAIHDGGVGAIFGDIKCSANNTMTIYDCLMIAQYAISNTDCWFGGLGSKVSGGYTTTGVIGNCLVYSKITDTTASSGTRTEASLLNGWGAGGGAYNWTINNTYSAAQLTYGGTTYGLYPCLYWTTNQAQFTVTGSNNYNYYANSTYISGAMGSTVKTPSSSIRWDGSAGKTLEDMWTKFRSDTSFNSKIWSNRSVINNAYMTNTNINSTTGYTLSNSPARNYMTVPPQDSEFTYTGEAIDITSAPWFMDDIHGDANMMTIAKPATIIDANEEGYNVVYNLKPGYYWSDGTTAPKTVKVKVKRAMLALKWVKTNGPATAVIDSGLMNRDRSNPPALTYVYYKDGAAIDGVPDKVGKYKVKAFLPDSSNYKLKNLPTDADPEFEFDLEASPVATPTASGGNEKPYGTWDTTIDGDGKIVFTLANDGEMNGGKIKELTQVDMPAGATYKNDNNVRTITVKSAGTYKINFTLRDEINTCWGEGGGELNLIVKPRPLDIVLARENGKSWEFEANTRESFTITHNSVDNDDIQLTIKYIAPPDGDGVEKEVTVGSDKLTYDADKPKMTRVTLDPLGLGNYKFVVGIAPKAASNANGNYAFPTAIEQAVTVVGKAVSISESEISWKYSDGQTVKALTHNLKIPYSGRTFTASIDTNGLAAKGIKVDRYEDATGTLADGTIHKTRVHLVALDNTYTFTPIVFEVWWEVEKALFDLSNVKWDYDAANPFRYTGSWITVTLKNVPTELTANFVGNQALSASGAANHAVVTFNCTNNNYVLPQKPTDGNKGTTYIYKPETTEDFPWTLDWYIQKSVINTNWDFFAGKKTDSAGSEFNYPKIIGAGNKVDYKFYTADDTPINLDDIVVVAGTGMTYKVEAVLKSDSTTSYTLAPGSKISFMVGQNKVALVLTLLTSGGTYDGQPKPITYSYAVKGEGELDSITDADFGVAYLDQAGNELSGAPVNAGQYKARITIVNAEAANNYNIFGTSTFDFTIAKCKIDTSSIAWDYDAENPFTFTRVENVAQSFKVQLTGLQTPLTATYINDDTFTNESPLVGSHRAKAEIDVAKLEQTGNYDTTGIADQIKNGKLVFTLDWKVEARVLTVPFLIVDAGFFDNKDKDAVGLIGVDADWAQYMTITVKLGATPLTNTIVRKANTYSVICTLLEELNGSIVWSNDETADQMSLLTIKPLPIKVVGWKSRPSVPIFEQQPKAEMYAVVYRDKNGAIVPDPKTKTGVKIRATVEVPANMTGNVIVNYAEGVANYSEFIIFADTAKLLAKPELVEAELEYNFEMQMFSIKNWRDYIDYVDLIGKIEEDEDTPLVVSAKLVGSKIVKVALRLDQNVMWDDGTEDPVELILTIKPAVLGESWKIDPKTKLPVLDFDDEYFESVVEYKYYTEQGGTIKPSRMSVGEDYSVRAFVKSQYQSMFVFEGANNQTTEKSSEYSFTFGAEPVVNPEPDPGTQPKPEDKTLGNLPLWQLAVSGISLLLFVVCAAKAAGEFGKAKAAKNEARELAQVSYSFAPALLMVGPFLGMQENMWTVIAFVSLGLFFLSLIMLVIGSKKRKAAELVLKREKARIAEEKEIAKEEEMMRREEQHRAEQQRRDDEMRMMFASMQQSFQQQPQFDYNNLQNMIASSMNALLPAMQQTMAALPPAQSDPSVYAQPSYGQPYGSPAEDQLRAQMAAQQEQMAQQQALINELMNGRQGGGDYRETAQDEAAWIDEGDEIVSLEELYGRMNDEAKRCYYEVGSYIMSKPKTSQNDGKYAVLFKFRGKTMFKLRIKNDVPVLYFLGDSGTRESVYIADASSLAGAKRVIDSVLMKADRQF